VIAYLFGLRSQTEPAGYVHLVAVREGYRRRGLARQLYRHFIEFARARGCREVKAITTPGNARSIAFHTALGMRMEGEPNAEGVPVVRDYSGPGEDRVVFRMAVVPEGLRPSGADGEEGDGPGQEGQPREAASGPTQQPPHRCA
jgi:GNAT superfamily N-acetyltransferase